MTIKLKDSLLDLKSKASKIFSDDFFKASPVIFDFSEHNQELKNLNILKIDSSTMDDLNKYIQKKLTQSNSSLGIGKYDEQRISYNSKLFTGEEEPRTIHLGIDLFVPGGTKIFAPLDGQIHSCKYNNNELDYGPTIILRHTYGSISFYTLYGHLSMGSIKNVKVSQKIMKGENFAYVGDRPTNGNWVPHLHFQLISDMLENYGDFPGVASLSARGKFLNLCPDPNLILNIQGLERT